MVVAGRQPRPRRTPGVRDAARDHELELEVEIEVAAGRRRRHPGRPPAAPPAGRGAPGADARRRRRARFERRDRRAVPVPDPAAARWRARHGAPQHDPAGRRRFRACTRCSSAPHPDARWVAARHPNAHPLPPKISTIAGVPSGLDTRQRDLDLAYLRGALDRTADPERVILVGDLNTTPLEPGFAAVADGLHDVHAEVASGTGFTWRPAFLEALDLGLLRIDHVLAGAAIQPVAITEDCSLPGDHCRVTAVVDVPDAD